MFGPGKYDDLCTHVRNEARADAAIVIIFGGSKGNGFSTQGPIELQMQLPQLLRAVALQIERDTKPGMKFGGGRG